MAVAVGGSAVLGYMGAQSQAGAAEDAANLQNQATLAGIKNQREMFDILNEQNKPYREAGYGALTRINEMLPTLTSPITAADIQNMPGYQFEIGRAHV